ncbi:hypothetical protein HJC23_009866 [Cyclotella cryptica]|uniref:Uncharacterized protein n=1 Tax=Cyclotella cryptica TaxID=29204 RepID=A0ABD3QAV5_9STRA|eukprot:CCRYP_006982-RA/>CCRYP_006982-RA protein AED:0.17 eAED:0.17 QI:0/-1/0/1/-1/1/1/0/360
MAQRRIIRVSARAFVHPREGSIVNSAGHKGGIVWSGGENGEERTGGNPVTVFYPVIGDNDSSKSVSLALSSKECSTLAKSCSWESIIIGAATDSNSSHTFRFFMPSGEEVSFCGHAAIGASAFVARKETLMHAFNSLSTKVDLTSSTVSFATPDNSKYVSKVCGDSVELIMRACHEENDCRQLPNAPPLIQLLNEFGLDLGDLNSNDCDDPFRWPTYVNSSVARKKTLIPIVSLERLHAASAPKDPSRFRRLCDSIDSTGIYLYSEDRTSTDDGSNVSFECRQFPRASGYAEDPATGIAAGALAASLYARGMRRDSYTFYQGTAMDRPSRIQVKIGSCGDCFLKLSYTGIVAFDSIACLE